MIRPAKVSDKAAVIVLMKQFFFAKGFDRADNPYGFAVEPDEAFAEHNFVSRISNPNSCVLVYDVDGTARGVLIADAVNHSFGRIRAAYEFMWWVDPKYRGRAHFKMIKGYKAWARERGCTIARMSHFEGDDLVGALYVRCGARLVERTYLFPL